MENDIKKITACIACGEVEHSLFCTKNKFDLYKCTQCGHVRIYPLIFDTSTIYDSDYFSGADKGHGYVDYDHDKEPMRAVFERYVRLIQKNLSTSSEGLNPRLLDVGAATGFFVAIAKDKGFDARGIEISDYAASLGRKRGLDIQTGTLSEDLSKQGLFDVITMWDVLEHFSNPDVDFETTKKLLKTEGILAINTPDVGSLCAKILGKKWHLLVPPEHLNYFNRNSLRLFLEKHGFELIVVTTIGKTFTLGYILQIFSVWTRISAFKRLATIVASSKWSSRLSLPVNLSDNMFVLARKK